MVPRHYLSRIGLSLEEMKTERETLVRLQRAHVISVPWENLSITGDPSGTNEGEGISLALPDLYQKIVEEQRGGVCYELNALFGWLLRVLGFAVERRSARIVDQEGKARLPAAHLLHLVELEKHYLVDVGLGVPVMRRPLPLDGSVHEDAAGVAWRIVRSERPDADFVSQYREENSDGWVDRYLFRDVPREMSYFAATCDYLQTAPESPFTGAPVLTMATGRGHKKLKPDVLVRLEQGRESKQPLIEGEWHEMLGREFGVRLPARQSTG